MITIYDVMGIPIYTADFLEPNILLLELIDYREGYIKVFLQMLTELLDDKLAHNSILHIIKVFNKQFYENELLSENDYDNASDKFAYLNEHWDRTYDIDVVPNETFAYKINSQKSKQYKGNTTISISVKSLDEALEIVKDYNLKHNI